MRIVIHTHAYTKTLTHTDTGRAGRVNHIALTRFCSAPTAKEHGGSGEHALCGHTGNLIFLFPEEDERGVNTTHTHTQTLNNKKKYCPVLERRIIPHILIVIHVHLFYLDSTCLKTLSKPGF